MSQPSGFVDPACPHYVCYLQKSLYGLKQFPRAWFHWINSFLFHFKFRQSQTHSSLFIFCRASSNIYLLLYVDDILITGSSDAFLIEFATLIAQQFDIKDSGLLSYFFGLQVTCDPIGLHSN